MSWYNPGSWFGDDPAPTPSEKAVGWFRAWWLILLAVAVAVWFFFFRKKA